jgi:hypothetical protein
MYATNLRRARSNDFSNGEGRSRDQPSISFSISFPTKAFLETAKCRQIKRFQSFIQSFPSFGRGLDSHRPLQILNAATSFSIFFLIFQ